MREAAVFYDDLADLHHLIFEDWPASIERQAAQLDAIIRPNVDGKRIADVACGIGTQSLGLASRGYEVVGSDLSSNALRRAQREAAARGLKIDFHLDDMRRLSTHPDASADVVIACDNAVPHLLSDDEVLGAFRQFWRVVKLGGMLIISVRDYAAIPREQWRFVSYGVRPQPDCKVAMFQVWQWDGNDFYDLNFYFVFDYGDRVESRVFRARYYAISIARLMEIARQAGFEDVRRVDDQFFQPLILGKRLR